MKNNMLRTYTLYLLANFHLLILSVAANGLSGYFRSLGSVYIQRITDALGGAIFEGLIYLILLGGFCQVVGFFFRWLGAISATYISEKFSFNSKLRLVEHLKNIPFIEFERLSVGNLISVFRNDTERSGHLLYAIISRILSNAFLLVFSIWIMAHINLQATAVILLIILASTAVNQLMLKKMKPHFTKSRAAMGDMTHSLERSFHALETVKTYGAKDYVVDALTKRNEEYCYRTRRAVDIDNIRVAWAMLIEKICLFAPLIYLGYLGITGVISIGQVVAYIYLVKEIVSPVEVIFKWMSYMVNMITCWGRVQEVLDIPVESSYIPVGESDTPAGSGELPPAIRPAAREFTANDVSFSYDGKTRILDGFKVALKKGEILRLAGESGSGKTTLFKLLLGLYRSPTAKYTVDQNPVPTFAGYTDYYSMENSIFPMSIYDNLALGRSHITKEQCRDVLARLGFGDWIDSLPDILDTVLTTGISGGQRQAITNARAILSDRHVLFLDEPFSALDPNHAQCLSAEINALRSSKAVLVTTHRTDDEISWDAVITLAKS